ncbi:ATP-dependent helicase HrpB [soil metagenome]
MLAASASAVLVAPPGAGKTTVVPLALLDAPGAADGKIIVLEPRRLAARAAAARMAWTLGEPVGETVGFRVRMQSKVSARTRIEVVTEGVFTRMILDDPGLDGIAAVLFDEFHERSLDADLGLAFARDSQQVLREDLRILVMSATLDGARVGRLLGDAPLVQSEGRMFPVETRYLGRDPAQRLEEQVVRAILRALADENGSLLVFLPGQGEIRRVETLLAERLRDPAVDIAPLYGAMDGRDQDRAIEPAPAGRRKVVLATSIAETSLTIEGVRVVIDAGLARVPRFDPASGLTRLETVRVSQAAADQRRGRAGRIEPGVCYRLWDEPETRSLAPFGRPEILDTDLSRLVLDLARWGSREEALAFLDPPPAAAMTEARALLVRLEALTLDGALTAHGRLIADLPLPPRLAHMVVRGAAGGQGARAAQIAAVLTERGLGGNDTDLRRRLELFARDSSPRAKDSKSLAERWARAAGRPASAAPLDDALLLAEAYPERIAKARGKPGEYQLVTGRGVYVEPTDALAREPWLAVGELGGGAARDRVLLAAPLDEALLLTAFADRIETDDRIEPDAKGKVRARRISRLGRLTLSERLIDKPDPAQITAALFGQVRVQGLAAVPFGEQCQRLRARIAFLRQRAPDDWPDLSDAALLEHLEGWLTPLLADRFSLQALNDTDLEASLRTLIPWDRQRALDTEAPDRWTAPTGSRLAIDYAAEGGPRIDVRVQELFGLAEHPTVGGVPLTLALLSPAHRPIQLTKDLPGFWRGTWKDVRSDMRGRYPKHVWPEDPASAVPTTRAKPRGT